MPNLLLFLFRASLLNVYFPSVTLCNINQFRGSLIRAVGLDHNETMLDAVLKQVTDRWSSDYGVSKRSDSQTGSDNQTKSRGFGLTV